jgi:serine/threonine-protein kinase RsbW
VEPEAPPDLALELANDFAQLSLALRRAEQFLAEAGLDPEVAYAVQLSLEEVLTNIIKYAYDDSRTHRIAVEVRREGPGLRLTVRDDGRRFDPLGAPAPDLAAPLSQRRAGGLGLHLVLSMMARVEYRRVDNHNILELWAAPRGDLPAQR